MSSAQSANYWQVETIKAIRNMFDDQVDEEVVSALFQENESDIERTVDAVLQHLREKDARKEEERSKLVSELELEFEEIPEEIEVSQVSCTQQSEVDYSQASSSVQDEEEEEELKESNYSESLASSTSSNNSVLIYEEKPDFAISEMETQTDYSPEEKLVQTEVEDLLSPDLRRFQERIEELSLSLSEAKFAKVRVEEEKKNAMKWCVSEMEGLRATVAEKDDIIKKQQEEIEMLRKMAQQPKAQEDNKLDKFIVESKQMIVEGVQNLSQQLSENIGKIQKEFKKVDDKDWIVVEKLKEFAADFRREISELFKEPIGGPFRKSPKKSIVSSPVVPVRVSPLQVQYEEEKQAWQLEKTSLESYIKELERQIKGYKDAASRRPSFVSESDVALVATQANVSLDKAREALIIHNGDVVNSILSLTM